MLTYDVHSECNAVPINMIKSFCGILHFPSHENLHMYKVQSAADFCHIAHKLKIQFNTHQPHAATNATTSTQLLGFMAPNAMCKMPDTIIERSKLVYVV